MVIVATLLDPITLDQEPSQEDRTLNPLLLVATVKHLFTHPQQVDRYCIIILPKKVKDDL
jgi:hypothetical protein